MGVSCHFCPRPGGGFRFMLWSHLRPKYWLLARTKALSRPPYQRTDEVLIVAGTANIWVRIYRAPLVWPVLLPFLSAKTSLMWNTPALFSVSVAWTCKIPVNKTFSFWPPKALGQKLKTVEENGI